MDNPIFPKEPDKNDLTNGNFEKDPEGTINKHKDDFKPNKVRRAVAWTAFLTLSLCIIAFLIIITMSRGSYQDRNDAYISNLTNTSIVQGYMVGYQMCNEGMMNMINQSVNTCQLIRANISGKPVELIPTSCLETK